MAILGSMQMPSEKAARGAALPTAPTVPNQTYVVGQNVAAHFSDAPANIAAHGAAMAERGMNALAKGIQNVGSLAHEVWNKNREIDIARAQKGLAELEIEGTKERERLAALQGEGAIGIDGKPDAEAQWNDWFKQAKAKHTEGLGEEGIYYFNTRADSYGASGASWANSHVRQETERYAETQLQFAIDAEGQTLAADPLGPGADAAMGRIYGLIDQKAARLGWSAEMAAQMKQRVAGKAWASAAAIALSTGNLQTAQAIVGKYGRTMSPEDWARLNQQYNAQVMGLASGYEAAGDYQALLALSKAAGAGDISAIALSRHGTPYVWGAADCSAHVRAVINGKYGAGTISGNAEEIMRQLSKKTGRPLMMNDMAIQLALNSGEGVVLAATGQRHAIREGRELGIGHVGIVIVKGGKLYVSEAQSGGGGRGVVETPLESFLQRYKGKNIYAADSKLLGAGRPQQGAQKPAESPAPGGAPAGEAARTPAAAKEGAKAAESPASGEAQAGAPAAETPAGASAGAPAAGAPASAPAAQSRPATVKMPPLGPAPTVGGRLGLSPANMLHLRAAQIPARANALVDEAVRGGGTLLEQKARAEALLQEQPEGMREKMLPTIRHRFSELAETDKIRQYEAFEQYKEEFKRKDLKDQMAEIRRLEAEGTFGSAQIRRLTAYLKMKEEDLYKNYYLPRFLGKMKKPSDNFSVNGMENALEELRESGVLSREHYSHLEKIYKKKLGAKKSEEKKERDRRADDYCTRINGYWREHLSGTYSTEIEEQIDKDVKLGKLSRSQGIFLKDFNRTGGTGKILQGGNAALKNAYNRRLGKIGRYMEDPPAELIRLIYEEVYGRNGGKAISREELEMILNEYMTTVYLAPKERAEENGEEPDLSQYMPFPGAIGRNYFRIMGGPGFEALSEVPGYVAKEYFRGVGKAATAAKDLITGFFEDREMPLWQALKEGRKATGAKVPPEAKPGLQKRMDAQGYNPDNEEDQKKVYLMERNAKKREARGGK